MVFALATLTGERDPAGVGRDPAHKLDATRSRWPSTRSSPAAPQTSRARCRGVSPTKRVKHGRWEGLQRTVDMYASWSHLGRGDVRCAPTGSYLRGLTVEPTSCHRCRRNGSATRGGWARRGVDVVLPRAVEPARRDRARGARIFRLPTSTRRTTDGSGVASLWRELRRRRRTAARHTGSSTTATRATVNAWRARSTPAARRTSDCPTRRPPNAVPRSASPGSPLPSRTVTVQPRHVAACARAGLMAGRAVRRHASCGALGLRRVAAATRHGRPVAVVTAGAWVSQVLGHGTPNVVVTQDRCSTSCNVERSGELHPSPTTVDLRPPHARRRPSRSTTTTRSGHRFRTTVARDLERTASCALRRGVDARSR